MKSRKYEVYAIKYAHHERKAQANFMDPTDLHDGEMPIDYFIWVIRLNSQIVVVDTGFNSETAVKRGRELIRCPTEGLRLMQINPHDVEDVVITHLHYDHVGNFDLFPNAKFHLQDKEMGFATGRNMLHKPFRAPIEVNHVTGMVEKLYADKVIFHNGSSELKPGLELHHIGGHTAGLQCVRVLTKRGWVVLASDASHLYANFQQTNPYPIIFREDEMLEGYETLKRLATSSKHIIPGHDPLVLDYYPSPNPALTGIVARLDEVEPENG